MSTVRIQIRRGTSTDWSSVNPTLAAGEIGFETNTKKIKVGDGTTAWNSLSYVSSDSGAVGEIAMDAIYSALSMGSGLTKSYNDPADSISIDIDPTVVQTVVRDTHANFVADTTTVYDEGVLLFETDTQKFKFGNGVDTYDNIYYNSLSTLGGALRGSLNMTLNTINHLGSPIQNDDAATKLYADTVEGNANNYTDLAISTHNTDVFNVHGIANTASLATQTYVNDIAGTAESNAAVYTNQEISFHNLNTTNVHGIADTADLATKVYAENVANTANSDANNYTDSAITTEISNRNSAISSAVSTHNSDTTSVHGIADTTELATKTYADDAALDAQTSAENYADSAVSTHNSDTTSVHGIADTSALATKTYADSAVSTHNSATTNVHGIANTANLATQSYANDVANTAESNANDYTDTEIATEVTNRNNAISSAISTEVTNRNSAISSAISTEVTNRNSAIATAKGEAISDSNDYTDNQIENLINGAPSTLDTLKELADALGSDPNLATTITNNIATAKSQAISTAEGYTDTAIGALTTSDIEEGSNLYYTDERAQDAIGLNLGTGLSYNDTTGAVSNSGVTAFNTRTGSVTLSDTDVNTALGYTAADAADLTTLTNNTSQDITDAITTAEAYTDTVVGALTTTDIPEGTRLYYTQERVQDEINNTIIGGTGIDATYVDNGSSSGTLTLDIDSTVVTLNGTQTLENKTLTAPVINSPTGITKSDVGLSNVNNTSDANKPISTATQSALDLKAPLASPTFTGTVTLPTGTVTSGMILDGTIVNADINASAAIALSKLATDPLDRANHTGTQTASTISDFNTQVRTSKVTDLTAPTSSFSMNSQKITNLATPTADGDAVNKQYVDAAVNNINIHESVVAATTGNVNLNNGVENNDVLDGVTLSTGNRILVKNQNTASQNGVYIVAANGAPSRATDYDAAGEVSAGDFIFVKGGTVNANTGWIQTADVTTVGTDSITFTQFSGAGTYTAGNGLTLTGTTFSINTGTTVDLSTAQTLTNKTLTSPTITGTGAIAGTFTGNLTGNVTGNVTGNAGTVTNGVYTTDTGTVTSTMIADGTIVNADINSSAAIAATKISGTAVTQADTGTVTNTMLAGSISNAKLTNSSITVNGTSFSLGDSKTIKASTTNALTIGTGLSGTSFDGGSGVTIAIDSTVATLTGNQTLTNKTITLPTIGGTGANFSGSTSGTINLIATATAGTNTITLPATTGIVVTTGDTGSVTSTMIADGTIVNADISSSAAIAVSKLAASTISGVTLGSNLNALTIGTGLSGTSYNGSGAVTIAIDSTVATLTGSQTLTNKTLSSAVATGGITHNGSTSGTTVVQASAVAGTTTLTLPAATDTLVGKATTDTFTNKTYDTAGTGNVFKINGTSISAVTGTGSVALSASPTFTGTVGAAAITTTGNVIVGGDLTVNGTTTTLSSTTLTVADKNIEIANVSTPTDVTANGAGITVKGASDKTFNWLSSTSSFTSSENVDLASGKTFKINGTTVLSSSQVLGYTLPAGTIVGTSDVQTLTNKTLTSPVISTISNTGTITLPTSTTTLVGRDTTDTLTNKTLSTSTAVDYTAGLTYNGSTGGTILKASSAASGTLTLPAATDTLVGKATTDTLTNKTFGQSVASTTVSFNNIATTVDTVALSGFTTLKYTVSIKQGSKIRSSVVMVQTDGTTVDATEFGIVETGGKISSVAVAANVSGSNMVLQVTIGDALTTSATVKLHKILL